MDLKDIIHEGKIDRDGMKNIQYLIDENKRLNDAFAYQNKFFVTRRYSGLISGEDMTVYYTKEEFKIDTDKENKKLHEKVEELESKNVTLFKIKRGIIDYLDKRIFIKTKDILKIINNAETD